MLDESVVTENNNKYYIFFLKGDKQNLKTYMTLKKSLYESITLV